MREALHDKLRGYIQRAQSTRTLSSSAASKLFGCANFLDHGCFGKVARAWLTAIKDRQCEGQSYLTPQLNLGLQSLGLVLDLRPSRVIAVRDLALSRPRFCAASDACLRRYQDGGAGCLLHLHPDTRLGAEFPLRPQVFDIFWAQDYVIAQLELLAVLQGIITFADQLRNTSRVWFIDNIAALMSLVRGRSDNGDLDNMASMVHFLLFAINCQCYFDWVESKANWSDGISRDGMYDTFWPKHGFRVHQSEVVTSLWSFPLRVQVRIFSFF